jgi:hypothetical protein
LSQSISSPNSNTTNEDYRILFLKRQTTDFGAVFRERLKDVDVDQTAPFRTKLFIGWQCCAANSLASRARFSTKLSAVDLHEFRNCLERMALLSTDGNLQVNHLPAAIRAEGDRTSI